MTTRVRLGDGSPLVDPEHAARSDRRNVVLEDTRIGRRYRVKAVHRHNQIGVCERAHRAFDGSTLGLIVRFDDGQLGLYRCHELDQVGPVTSEAARLDTGTCRT